MSKIKTGIVGCGGIASAHMGDFYSKQDDIKVSACVDQNRKASEAFGDRYGIEPGRRYESLDALLENEKDIRAIDICTPPNFHAEQIKKGVLSGKHVLTEKPLATDYNQASEAVNAAKEKGVIVMVMQNYRWRPEYVQAKNLMNANWIGKPTMITTLSRHDWHAFGADNYRKTMPVMSLLELSIHYADLFRFLLGCEATRIFACAGRSENSPYMGDTYSAMVIAFSDGCIANLVTSAELLGAKANWGAETTIQGTNGSIWLNRDNDFELSAYSRVFGGYMPASVMTPAKGWFGEPLECFYSCIEKNVEPPTSGLDNLKSLRLVLAAAESAKTGKAITI